jgi:hypothetical protein
LKSTEILYLDRLKVDGDQIAAEDNYKLNYTFAFFHKYWGEESIAAEYCKNIENYLLSHYPENHNKVRRFYQFFASEDLDNQGEEEEQLPERSYRNDGESSFRQDT